MLCQRLHWVAAHFFTEPHRVCFGDENRAFEIKRLKHEIARVKDVIDWLKRIGTDGLLPMTMSLCRLE